MTPSGIKPAIFRFVAQHLNHCATAVLTIYLVVSQIFRVTAASDDASPCVAIPEIVSSLPPLLTVNVSGHGNAHPLTQAPLHNLLADHSISFTAEFRVHYWAMGETCSGPVLL
jgi:hypothetical protein